MGFVAGARHGGSAIGWPGFLSRAFCSGSTTASSFPGPFWQCWCRRIQNAGRQPGFRIAIRRAGCLLAGQHERVPRPTAGFSKAKRETGQRPHATSTSQGDSPLLRTASRHRTCALVRLSTSSTSAHRPISPMGLVFSTNTGAAVTTDRSGAELLCSVGAAGREKTAGKTLDEASMGIHGMWAWLAMRRRRPPPPPKADSRSPWTQPWVPTAAVQPAGFCHPKVLVRPVAFETSGVHSPPPIQSWPREKG